MNTGWTVVLAVSIALNVIFGYREVRRAIWKAKRKYGKTTRSSKNYSGGRGGNSQYRGRTSGNGTPPKYYRGRKYGGYGNERRGGRDG